MVEIFKFPIEDYSLSEKDINRFLEERNIPKFDIQMSMNNDYVIVLVKY